MSSNNDASPSSSSAAATAPVNKNKRYRKDKPWDNDSIDHWAIEPVTADNGFEPPLEESSFATLFPAYREKYLQQVWPLVTRSLKAVGVKCELNLTEGSMCVRTSRKTYDPYMIIKARDLIKLLSRSVPAQQALKILQDDMHCDIIKIKNAVRNKERFVKRRQRLIGPNGCTLKAIELVTECYVFVQGNTVSAMGTIKGIKAVRSIVMDCMKNIHPIYNIKTHMIKRELEQNPELKNESWDRFLPKFKKKNIKRKKVVIKTKPRDRTPFPPAPTPRKVDLELESGEYFLTQTAKDDKALQEKHAKSAERSKAKKRARAAEFQAPDESVVGSSAKKQRGGAGGGEMSIDDLKAKFKAQSKANAAQATTQRGSDFVQ